jgi:hypothetical protein
MRIRKRRTGTPKGGDMRISIARIGPNESLTEAGTDGNIAVSVSFSDVTDPRRCSGTVELFLPRLEIGALSLTQIHEKAVQEAYLFLERVLATRKPVLPS